MLIGVDHGNKQIKTVHCNPFVSGLKQSVTRPFGQNVLRYQNTYYTLSTERIPYRKDKTEDDRFFILTLFALAGEIEARGAYSTEVQRIQLAVGLPPAHFGAQVERFTQYFRQRGVIEFEMQGKPYSIYIEDYKSHLNVQDLINDDIEKNLTDLIYKIDGILVNKKPYDKNTITDIEAKVSENKPQNDNYKPVYNVFRLIVEELDLE